MALALTTRGTAYHASASSVASSSFTPAGGALLVVLVEELNTGTPTLTVTSTFAGQGSWTYYTVQASNGYEVHTSRIAVSVCGASPGSGTITVTRSGGGSTYGMFAEFLELTGQHASTPVRQSKTNSSTGTSLALNFDSAPEATSISLFTILEGNNNPTIPSGTTQLGSQSITGGSFYGEHAYDTSPAQNNSWTNLGSFYANGVAVEIAANLGTNASAGAATATGTANAAGKSIAPTSTGATASSSAGSATGRVAPTAQAATATGAAQTPSVSTLSSTANAPAGTAAATGLAAAPGPSVAPAGTGTATGAGSASAAAPSTEVDAAAGTATAAGAAYAASVFTVEPPVVVRYRATDTELLDLTVSQRAEGYEFLLLDTQNNPIGTVHPQLGVSIDHNTSQAIMRRMTSFKIAPDEFDAVNPLTDRVMPRMILENGSRYPLGVFLFADTPAPEWSFGSMYDATLVDQGHILGQALRYPIGFNAGDLVVDCLRQVAETAGISTAFIDPSSATLGAPLTFLAGGSDTYMKIMVQLCGLAGFYAPYFDNYGRLRCRVAVDPETTSPTLTYEAGGRIIAGSIIRSNNLLSAPNVYVVYDNSATEAPVRAEWPIPDTAPHSIARRGYAIPKVVEAPGIGNNDQALAYAKQLAQTEPAAYETVNFQGANDPRHDTFDVVQFLGNLYIETAWSFVCSPGGPMGHELKRVYV